MGEFGPIPKRSDQRVRRNIPETPVTVLPVTTKPVKAPPMGIPDAHPIVSQLWDSLAKSAQAQFYEPSDWAVARLALHFANKEIWSAKPNGQILATVNQMLTSLLMSEGDRRRMNLEIQRNTTDAVVTDIASMFKEQLGAQSRAR
ncbi:terminase small subunit [Mycobacterium phage DroogsArmy]|uniref:Terminase small subunit n=1 Tax=Mycobacterium phage DroogsArmy TaxID=2744011 RepID=A0A6N0A6X9_9CAUD|nr:terminase small subunit [Mycobacterium phage DroogsArmy]QKO02399.1 terminase small subunit [Mycobacterium phage DroogsArmy]